MTNAALLIDNPRAFVNADPVLDRAPALLTNRVTFSAWLLAAQALPQAATTAFVFINVHVDRLMADSQSGFNPAELTPLKKAILAEQGDRLIGTVEQEHLFELMDQLAA